jgi:hypothetical protein
MRCIANVWPTAAARSNHSRPACASVACSITPRLTIASVLPAAAACSYHSRAACGLAVLELQAEAEHGAGVAGGGGLLVPLAPRLRVAVAEAAHRDGVAGGGGPFVHSRAVCASVACNIRPRLSIASLLPAAAACSYHARAACGSLSLSSTPR